MAIVRYKASEIPPMTAEDEAELKALAELPDSEIDFSDIPELGEDFFKNAVIGRFYRPLKKHTSIRIDADVFAWLQKRGKGYQAQINAILREAMLRDLSSTIRN